MARVLFILRKRGVPYQYNSPIRSDWAKNSWTGLGNSVRYVSEMLSRRLGIESKWVAVDDNNDIDREVRAFRPTHCIIEALWVVPSKFEILTKLHPKVKWDIRLHSEVPFLAQEGISIDWIFDYYKHPKVITSSNSLRLQDTLSKLLGPTRPVPYTPNFYPIPELKEESKFPRMVCDICHKVYLTITMRFVFYTDGSTKNVCNNDYYNETLKDTFDHVEPEPRPPNPPPSDAINIGCFGAVRPLKNQLTQAVAAILFANELKKKLIFHINGERLEMGGEPVFRNVVNLFKHSFPHKLVIDGWVNIKEFTDLVKTMDIGMQVSFTETFNIVSADFAANNIPLIVSPEVSWASRFFMANPTDVNDIISKLHKAWAGRFNDLQHLNKVGLVAYNRDSIEAWEKYFRKEF